MASERRSDLLDDSRPPTDENGNVMNDAGRVMKAAGEGTKIRGTVVR
jgi:hypothetical protein